ncbi:MAG: hypothetical protein N2D54_06450, partial [Chloroflexota bacterium]
MLPTAANSASLTTGWPHFAHFALADFRRISFSLLPIAPVISKTFSGQIGMHSLQDMQASLSNHNSVEYESSTIYIAWVGQTCLQNPHREQFSFTNNCGILACFFTPIILLGSILVTACSRYPTAIQVGF